ncbi:sialate O-acetylesterase [Lignipirellula cremea]|uniref:Carbohydrate acetyl esterase/feruloyl esterase n=1 Tax=Lignipirellula cremea TaxID=2528010 RepID=A0A518DME0_9BACT|nr:sialate O-acetylesterase [Lignipirellula cremea]QDU93005.1 Carbohydrate acetyl esterase/feruloyl esterase precursor [Lignipirellula cremea]
MFVRRWFLLLPGLLAGLFLLPALSQGGEPPAPEQFHLFLLVGQSNMAGRGKVAEQDKTPHPQVLMFTRKQTWEPAVDPLHFDKGSAGVGLGKTFAIEYAKAHPGVTVGLIPCAVGGSPIAAWDVGGYHSSTKTHPWDDAMVRAKAALPAGQLKGILWHQGESDASAALSEVYEEKLLTLIDRFRKELAAPEVPFIAGQMGQFEGAPWNAYKKKVDAAHQALPNNKPLTAFVSSEGLNHKGDMVHFDADSYRELGRRYYKAFVALTAEPAASR